MEEVMSLVNERVYRDALVLTKVLEGVGCVQRVDGNIDLATIAAGMQLICLFLEGIGKGGLPRTSTMHWIASSRKSMRLLGRLVMFTMIGTT